MTVCSKETKHISVIKNVFYTIFAISICLGLGKLIIHQEDVAIALSLKSVTTPIAIMLLSNFLEIYQ